MGQKQSRDKLLYQHVINGDNYGIKNLSRQGVSLEWKDKEGRTPLIVACKNSGLYSVAKTLIELGANINAFSKGNGGTPLHYAAKEGLQQTVALLLSHGANPFVKNSKHETPLDVARKNQQHAVAREIESRICYFAGEIREVYGPGFSDASAPQLSSRIIWVVVVPRSPPNPPRRPTLELVIYSTSQDVVPRKVLSLRKCKIKWPKFEQPNSAFVIFDRRSKTRYKLTSVLAGGKQQLRRLHNACKGISQVTPASTQLSSLPLVPPLKLPAVRSPPEIGTLHNNNNNNNNNNNHGSIGECYVISNRPNEYLDAETNIIQSPVVQTPDHRFGPAPQSPVPSAPPITVLDDHEDSVHNYMEDYKSSNSCVICWEAPVEGAYVPCGHSGCISCLNLVRLNHGVCHVCRSDIAQVIKLYGV